MINVVTFVSFCSGLLLPGANETGTEGFEKKETKATKSGSRAHNGGETRYGAEDGR
jgi:hypothetical protein